MKVELCKTCGGTGDIFSPDCDDWVYKIQRHEANHKDFTKVCPSCNGDCITPPVTRWNGVALDLTVEWNGIFGDFTTTYLIKTKPGLAGKGYDLWANGKKITRGSKYLVAGNHNQAIANILKGSDYKSYKTAEVTT